MTKEGDPVLLPSVGGVEMLRLIGEGYTARIYLGVQHHLGRQVAVKVLRVPGGWGISSTLFDNENRTLGQLASHPNILTVFEAGVTSDGFPYLVTEYLPDGTIEDRVGRDGPMPRSDVLDVGVRLAGAIETAHNHGIIHGDVKPKNILIGRTGQPMLGDFGLATLRSSPQFQDRTRLTPTGGAPELGAGGSPSVLTDVFGLADCLVRLLGPGGVEGSESAGNLPEPIDDLTSLLAEGTASDPTRRPQTALAFGLALQEIQRDQGLVVTPIDVMEPIDPTAVPSHEVRSPLDGSADPESRPAAFSGRSLVAIGGCGLAVLVALVVTIIITAGSGDSSSEATEEKVPDSDVDGVEQSDPASEDPLASPPVTEVIPESELQGVQPGIDFDVEVPEQTIDELDLLLAEESVIFHTLGGQQVQPSPYYGIPFTSYPARFNFQAFNPGSDMLTCRGIMTRGLTVVEVWERGAAWPDGRFQVSVARMAAPWMAHELATAMSLTNGVESSSCRGMARFGVEDYEDYGVLNRDVARLMPSGDNYNHWGATDVPLGDRVWPYSTRMVLEADPYVIDIALVTDEPLLMGNDEAVAEIADQIINRL